MYPQNKFVQGQARQRGQVFPIERCPSRQRSCEQVRQGDDDDVGISLLALDVEKAFSSSAPGLIDGDKWLRRQIMLADEGSDEPRQHIRATTRASRDDQFHRFLGFPGRDVAEPYEQYRQYACHRCRPDPLLHVGLLWRQLFLILTPRYERSVDSAVRYAKNVRWMRLLQPYPGAVIAALHLWKNSPCLYAQSRSHTSQGWQNFLAGKLGGSLHLTGDCCAEQESGQ